MKRRAASDEVRGAWAALADEAEALREGVRDLPVASAPDPARLRADVERLFPFDGPAPLPDLVREYRKGWELT